MEEAGKIQGKVGKGHPPRERLLLMICRLRKKRSED